MFFNCFPALLWFCVYYLIITIIIIIIIITVLANTVWIWQINVFITQWDRMPRAYSFITRMTLC